MSRPILTNSRGNLGDGGHAPPLSVAANYTGGNLGNSFSNYVRTLEPASE